MNPQRKSLDEIFNSQAQPSQRRSLDEIFTPQQVQTPQQTNPQTMLRSGNGNYLENITPSVAQPVMNFAGDMLSEVARPFQRIGNSVLNTVNKGVEAVTGRQAPQGMQVTPGSTYTRNIVSGENADVLGRDNTTGRELTPAQAALNAVGNVAEGALNLYTGGKGRAALSAVKPTLMQAVKPLAAQGLKAGAGYGLASGIQDTESLDTASPWAKMFLTTGIGAIGGGLLGAGLGAVSHGLHMKSVNSINEAVSGFDKAMREGNSEAAGQILQSPTMQKYLKQIGAGTPEEANQTVNKLVTNFQEEISKSNNSSLQNFTRQEDFPEVVKTVLENANSTTQQGNRVDWGNTRTAIEKKLSSLGSVLDDISTKAKQGKIDTSFGVTLDEMMGYMSQHSSDLVSKGQEWSSRADSALEKAISELANRTKNGKISLSDLSAVRTLGNSKFGEDSVVAQAGQMLADASRKAIQNRLDSPQTYGIDDMSMSVLNDYNQLYKEMANLNKAATFLNKWKSEPAVRGSAIAQQFAGALGFSGTGSFFGYLGAQALANKLMSASGKELIGRLYGSPAVKAGALERTEKLSSGLLDNLTKIGEQQAETKAKLDRTNIIKQLAKAKEQAVTDAKYSPPNQSLYEPYALGEDIQMGNLPKKTSTEPYIDSDTQELVNPKTKARLLKPLGVAGALGIAGVSGASAMQKGTPAQSPRHKNNPLELTEQQKENIKEAIAGNESGGEKDPYSAVNTKASAHGTDRGRFQFSDSLREELTKIYFGKVIPPKDFTPAVQEELMSKHIESMLANGFSVGQIFRIHRKGLKGMMSKTAMDYGEEALAKYKKLEKKTSSSVATPAQDTEELARRKEVERGNSMDYSKDIMKYLKQQS